MPSFMKDGKKKFAMNPQVAHSMAGAKGMSEKTEERLEEKVAPGIHEAVGEEAAKLKNYDGHDFNGHQLAHHVELHHGSHPDGEPAAHEGHTHHTIAHPHGEESGEPIIRNHESAEEAHQEEDGAMHEGCDECPVGHGGVEADRVSGDETSEEV